MFVMVDKVAVGKVPTRKKMEYHRYLAPSEEKRLFWRI